MNKAYYNYRYFLPYAPEWGAKEFCNKRLYELLAFCHEAKVDAVQFFVNTLPGTYYMPAHNAAEQLHWAKWMKENVAPALREKGISYQLNFQMILGATSQGLDMRDEYEWEFLVDHHGHEALGCACPLGLKFRKKMGEMLRLWAGTEPDVIWIDDDFRMHNHGFENGELDFYCYCETHLNKFAKFLGKSYSREELITEVLKPGSPTKLRQQWLDFLSDTMAESAEWIRSEIQGICSDIRLALMTSCPDVHSAEGRDWKKILNALCGEFPPIIRPCSGIYSGTLVPPKQQTITYRFMGHSIAVVEDSLGADVADYAPELENTRFTTWCKSVRNSEYVLMLGQLLGCPEITLSLSDLDGSPINEEPTNLKLLQKNKPRLDALAELELKNWTPQGVAFICDPDAARKQHVSANAKMQDLGRLRKWEDSLLQMGIPAYYTTSENAAGNKDVVVLEGYTAWCPSDEDLLKILSGNVFLDGEAAWVLQQRGFGDYMGVNVLESRNNAVQAEMFNDGVLPDLGKIRVPNRNRYWYEINLTHAIEVSRFIDPKNRFYTGSAIFENNFGGRIGIYAGVGNTEGNSSHAHLRWLHGILRWLSREKFCALPIIPHQGLTLMRKNAKQTLFSFANLGTDAINDVKIHFAGCYSSLKILERSGKWLLKKLKDETATQKGIIPCKLETFEWLVVILE